MLAVLLVALATVSLTIGSKSLSLQQIFSALADPVESVERSLILSSRLVFPNF